MFALAGLAPASRVTCSILCYALWRQAGLPEPFAFFSANLDDSANVNQVGGNRTLILGTTARCSNRLSYTPVRETGFSPVSRNPLFRVFFCARRGHAFAL